MSRARLLVVAAMILAAALSRLLPHPPNFTSVAALALFGGATLGERWLAYLMPLVALFVSDIVLGFYAHMEIVYLAFVMIVVMGQLLRRWKTPFAVGTAAIASSIVFYLITNFGVWLFDGFYPKTLAGLVLCYVAAIPFFWNTLASDVLYSALLFGGVALAERHFVALREDLSLGSRAS